MGFDLLMDIFVARQRPTSISNVGGSFFAVTGVRECEAGERRSAQVRRAVAANPNTPATALALLADDKDDEVREAVAFNSATPPEVAGYRGTSLGGGRTVPSRSWTGPTGREGPAGAGGRGLGVGAGCGGGGSVTGLP